MVERGDCLMKIRVYVVALMTLMVTGPAKATTSGLLLPARTEVTAEITRCQELFGPLVFREGEILEVDGDYIKVAGNHGVVETLKLTTDCQIFVNGRQGTLSALRPVAPGFSFMIRLYVDQQGVPRLVDGWYIGGLVTVIAISPQENFLLVQDLESNRVYRLLISQALKEETRLLAPGVTCFLLLDWETQVRKFFVDEISLGRIKREFSE